MTPLEESENFTLREEEGPQSKPLAGDPGLATNWGITLARLSEWRGTACTPDDVWSLSYEEASAIFHAGYWNALRCWGLWPGLDLMIADHGFNAGAGTSARILQKLLGVTVDLKIGAITAGAARAVTDRAGVLARLRDAQEADYRADSDFPQFGAEWVGDPAAADTWRRQGRLGRRYARALTLAGLATPAPAAAPAAG